jgi:riboflavin kinase/FMN adenylyltransferase
MIEVQLLNYERPEQKFASLDDLKARIELDKQYASEYMKNHPECK